ncbi:hypothetical protein NE237_003528 [Protea cynaroides]|uniref:SURP and G-patch domain-containing protein 1-like protein n=1 Tax=Protea cynaroides TaxID=273540 RepID=A0A9Q0KH80_9MAGN|nr:hypothetical protein NE237_003528 [Protea cynaroides]
MEKGSSLFVNDGSFMERFKQLQQEKAKEAGLEQSKSSINTSGTLRGNPSIMKTGLDTKTPEKRKAIPISGGKLAFSLKQKSKLVAAPVKLGADEDEDEEDAENGSGDGPEKRKKLDQPDASVPSSCKGDVGNYCSAPPSPSDPTVKKVADKLASFVAKNGRQFEHITRQRNPGDTPFKFLYDVTCPDYKYYEYQLVEEETALAQNADSQASQNASASVSSSRGSNGSQRPPHQHSNYQIPASALYEANDEKRSSVSSTQKASTGRTSFQGESSAPPASDPIAMMEFYMKKAAQEEKMRRPKQSKDEMPPPASLQAPVKKGHHMGDYIPQEELEKFLGSCNDVACQRAAEEAAEKAKIQADNVGHKLLSKMGWKEGEGLGSSKSGRADPIKAGSVRLNNLGVGASQPGEVTPEDDIYEQYKKRMMLGYRYRPNPLNNPRKAYY